MAGPSPETVARILYNAYGSRDFEKAAEWVAEDALLTNAATGDVYTGPAGYLDYVRGLASAYPDLRVEVLDIMGADDGAAVQYVLRGTHTGALVSPAGFIPATWAQVELRICDVLDIEGEKVRGLVTYFDAATLLRQLGLLQNSPLHAPDRRATLGLFATEMDNSAEQRNKVLVQRYLEESINQKNLAAATATCVPGIAWHGGAIGEASGIPGFQSVLASLFASFPDLHVEIQDVIAEEDRVAVRVTLSGTQLGSFQGIAATGKRIVSSGTNTYRIAGDRIAEEWWQHDLLGIMRQLDPQPPLADGTP